MDPATIGLITSGLGGIAKGLFGGSSSGNQTPTQITTTVTDTNSSSLQFSPNLVLNAGGVADPSSGGTLSASPSTSSAPTFTGPTATQPGVFTVPGMPASGAPISLGTLSGSQLLLIGGLALMAVVAMGAKHR